MCSRTIVSKDLQHKFWLLFHVRLFISGVYIAALLIAHVVGSLFYMEKLAVLTLSLLNLMRLNHRMDVILVD